jgi:hypothetical protein
MRGSGREACLRLRVVERTLRLSGLGSAGNARGVGRGGGVDADGSTIALLVLSGRGRTRSSRSGREKTASPSSRRLALKGGGGVEEVVSMTVSFVLLPALFVEDRVADLAWREFAASRRGDGGKGGAGRTGRGGGVGATVRVGSGRRSRCWTSGCYGGGRACLRGRSGEMSAGGGSGGGAEFVERRRVRWDVGCGDRGV